MSLFKKAKTPSIEEEEEVVLQKNITQGGGKYYCETCGLRLLITSEEARYSLHTGKKKCVRTVLRCPLYYPFLYNAGHTTHAVEEEPKK